mmetsp:Transcript_108939/g.347814  ORF Transcript_108939/g.347814 Transcript_108939/m.347814 type:complete len:258 (+) Transcript_108939:140-913(+)
MESPPKLHVRNGRRSKVFSRANSRGNEAPPENWHVHATNSLEALPGRPCSPRQQLVGPRGPRPQAASWQPRPATIAGGVSGSAAAWARWPTASGVPRCCHRHSRRRHNCRSHNAALQGPAAAPTPVPAPRPAEVEPAADASGGVDFGRLGGGRMSVVEMWKSLIPHTDSLRAPPPTSSLIAVESSDAVPSRASPEAPSSPASAAAVFGLCRRRGDAKTELPPPHLPPPPLPRSPGGQEERLARAWVRQAGGTPSIRA